MSKVHNDYIEVYKDKGEDWRWRKIDGGNHGKIASSGEGFGSQRNAIKAGFRANEGVPLFLVVDKDTTVEIDPNEYA